MRRTIDQELRLRQNEYCTFRTIKTLVISWNIDATTPAHLAGSPQNTEFLAQALASVDSPDIIVFGFQEVIDLEHKGLTASTFDLYSISLSIIRTEQNMASRQKRCCSGINS